MTHATAAREAVRHQPPGPASTSTVAARSRPLRLTQYARGAGCGNKIPPAELEALVAAASVRTPPAVLAGIGSDAAVLALPGGGAVVTSADFTNAVVDDPHEWGRIAAADALSAIYAVGGTPIAAVNLLAWPRRTVGLDVAAAVLRGSLGTCLAAGCPVTGGHSVEDPEPKFGLAVTGWADPARMLRLDRGRAGMPLTLTKPLGLGMLTARHKATGEVFAEAIAVMTRLNADASAAALACGAVCATDVGGSGLLGAVYTLARASGVSARLDPAAVPYVEPARSALAAGYVSGGTRRNLEWVRSHLEPGRHPHAELLLLADAQVSGGLLVAGEIPGHPVIGELTAPGPDWATISLR